MKNLILLFSCLIGPLGFAQNATIDHLVADFERSKAMSMEYIDAMPEDQFNYKPTEGVRTFAAQMLHGAQGTIGLAANGTGEAAIYGDVNIEQEASFQSKSEVRRIVAESFDFAIAGIQNMDPSKFDEVVVRGPYNVTRLGWIQKANEHVGHHRGQCAIYLRMQGITPPAYKLF
ncbi:DinB family protein [uncultured Muriicola sp.]|uniref:DinB family protein n=1 Tax=uncultured Muriicola sp. TaxID=1583102 RepID=UPI0026083779|nr:DinB family protein [uncultured Muriicola sp.]